MAKKKKEPEFTHCKVKQAANPRAPWRVFFTAEKDGKASRVFKSFSTKDKAERFAEGKEIEIANHGIRFGDITPEVRRAFDFYRDEVIALSALGVTVPRFEDLVSNSLATLRAVHQAAAENAVTVAEGVAQFVDYKRTRVKDRQLANLKNQLKRFAQDFGDRAVASITTAEIDTWLSSLRSRKNPDNLPLSPLVGPLTRNHHRAALYAFFAHGAARARAWSDRNPVADLEPEQFETEEPEAYTPEDAAKLIQAALTANAELVPLLALGMFAGLRVSEAAEIDLGKLTKDTTEFRATGKTGPRMVPYTDTARAWIEAQPRRTGKGWRQSART